MEIEQKINKYNFSESRVMYEGQSISNASYFFFLLYFSRKLKYNYIA